MNRGSRAAAWALFGAAVVVAATVGWRHHIVRQLRLPVLAQLSDPDAALFRNEIVVGPWTVSNSILCGEVNARNKAGGYVGYHFFDAHERAIILEDDSMKESFDRAGIKRCDFSKDDAVKWWWMRW